MASYQYEQQCHAPSTVKFIFKIFQLWDGGGRWITTVTDGNLIK